MFLYNETIGIDKDIEQQWLQWMQHNHMPAIMRLDIFRDARLYKILHNTDDNTVSYSAQYFADSITDVQRYLDQHEPALTQHLRNAFPDRHVVFRTLLEEQTVEKAKSP